MSPCVLECFNFAPKAECWIWNGGLNNISQNFGGEIWVPCHFALCLGKLALLQHVPPQGSVLPLSHSFSQFRPQVEVLTRSLGASSLCPWCSFWPPQVCRPVFIGSESEDACLSVALGHLAVFSLPSLLLHFGMSLRWLWGIWSCPPSPHFSLLFSIPLPFKMNSSGSAWPGLPAPICSSHVSFLLSARLF